MLIFPDPSVETEYTDPNGSVWRFNDTGWVRECDFPDGGGGGDADVQGGQVPAGYINLGTTAYDGSITTDRTSTPICFGNDIYRFSEAFAEPASRWTFGEKFIDNSSSDVISHFLQLSIDFINRLMLILPQDFGNESTVCESQ